MREEIEKQVTELLKAAEELDAEEDREFGKETNGHQMPDFLKDDEARKRWIAEQLEALRNRSSSESVLSSPEAEKESNDSEEATEQTPSQKKKELTKEEKAQKLKQLKKLEKLINAESALNESEGARKADDPSGRKEREGNRKRGGKPYVPAVNITDPDARKMKFNNGGFHEGYNGQIAVDQTCGIIVAALMSHDANDQRLLEPVLEQAQANVGLLPKKVSADTGYFNLSHIEAPAFANVEFFVAPKKPGAKERLDSKSQQMRNKLDTPRGKYVYSMRKAIVEPVFGAIKHARNFRHLLTRGMKMVEAEWYLACSTHNLLKLYSKWAAC